MVVIVVRPRAACRYSATYIGNNRPIALYVIQFRNGSFIVMSINLINSLLYESSYCYCCTLHNKVRNSKTMTQVYLICS